jgi:hypothetical protein
MLIPLVSFSATVVEFYHADLDNFFITADPGEQAFVDSGAVGNWKRTGSVFETGGPQQVCRFYGSSVGPNSHFYTADPGECSQLKLIYNPSVKSWKFESNDFQIANAVGGACPQNQYPIYRAYNNGYAFGVDSNHRISASKAAIQEVVNRGWNDEGIVMCMSGGGLPASSPACPSPQLIMNSACVCPSPMDMVGGRCVSPVISAVDGMWNCSASSTVIQIVGAKYYRLGSLFAQGYSTLEKLSLNKGIGLGPDTAHYGGAGNLASQIINDREYKIVHLVDKAGYASFVTSYPVPIGEGTEFSLNTNGTLKFSRYIARVSYDNVYGPNVGKPADQSPIEDTCVKMPITTMPPIVAPISTQPTIAYRSVKKPVISGLGYLSNASGSIPWHTDDKGQFPVIVSGKNQMTFSVGGITLFRMSENDAMAFTLATLYQLEFFLNSGISTDIEVQNLMAFLMVIDDDGDYTNGIQITSKVREVAAGLSINFSQSSAAFYSDVSVLSAAALLSSNTTAGKRTLPSVASAITASK